MKTHQGNVWHLIRRQKNALENDYGIPPLISPDYNLYILNSNEDKVNSLTTFFEEQHSLTVNKSDILIKFEVEQIRFLMDNINPQTQIQE